jgi:hypothetical protein
MSRPPFALQLHRTTVWCGATLNVYGATNREKLSDLGYYLGAALGRHPDSPSLDHLDNPDARMRCPECDTWEGSLHVPGCDIERCGVCGRQLSSCACPRTGDTPRVPYINWPLVCARCGGLWPCLFRVPGGELEHYIQINRRRAKPRQHILDACAELSRLTRSRMDELKEKQLLSRHLPSTCTAWWRGTIQD